MKYPRIHFLKILLFFKLLFQITNFCVFAFFDKNIFLNFTHYLFIWTWILLKLIFFASSKNDFFQFVYLVL